MLDETEVAEFKELMDEADKFGDKWVNVYMYLDKMQKRTRDHDVLNIEWVSRILSNTVLPPAYIAGIRMELLQMVGKPDADLTYVYMSFWGMEDRADYMKVGVAKNVRKRMSGAHTDNPMNRLWTFTIPLHTRQEALNVEAALLKHMCESRITGEWVKLSKFSAQACRALAESLAEVAAEQVERAVQATGG
ncbi:MAG: hypothetical protein A3E01_04625 [Gammaproteobacteria bacterium RIFCSPHIGHO2_12_FULL_63_22]|nr:MAG: hypothetical protein A3E01_04625 [Gammaproteobacteria bacterium RIFCSPHIGHO2_12_FULL_63_22]